MTMKIMGSTLIVMAVLLHFSLCEWNFGLHDPRAAVVPFVLARQQFQKADGEYNIAGAGFWGLVIPVLLGGGGIALLNRDNAGTSEGK